MRLGAEGSLVNCKRMVCAVVVWAAWGVERLARRRRRTPRVAAIVADMKQSQALTAAGKYSEALPNQLKVVQGVKDVFGEDHYYYGVQLNTLADLYLVMGQYVKAEPLYERSLKILEKQQGPDHPDVAISLSNLARLYQEMGQYVNAESLFERRP